MLFAMNRALLIATQTMGGTMQAVVAHAARIR
jgi:hypothetical protein